MRQRSLLATTFGNFYLESIRGLALAVVLIGGKRYAWSVFIGSLLMANVMAADSLFWADIAIALGNALAALLGAWLITRNGMLVPSMDSLRDFLRLVLLGGCVASTASTLVGNTALLASGFIGSGEYLYSLLRWWMGDVLGIILVTTLILSWRKKEYLHEVSKARAAEAILLLGLTFLVGQIVFLDWFHDSIGSVAKGYWMFLFVAWLAVRLGVRGVTVALVVMALQALWGAHQDVGFFGKDLAEAQLANLWFFMITLSVVGMALATYFAERKHAEEKLAESLALLQAVIDTSPMRIFWKDKELRYLGCNAGFAKDAGEARPEDLVGKDDYQLGWKAQAELYRADDRQVMESGIPKVSYDEPITAPDGHQLWVRTSKVSLRDQANEIIGVLGIYEDITERKRADEALRRSEAMLHTLYDSTSDAVMLLDEKGFLDCNQATLTMFGCTTKEEFCSLHPADLSPPEQSCGVDSMTLANEQIAAAMAKGRNLFEWMHRRVDTGRDFSAEVLLSRMELDGRKVLQATVRDISERKHAEELAQQFGSLLQGSFDEIYMFDAYSLHFLLTSKGAEENLGYTSEELNHLTPIDIKPLFTEQSFEKLAAPLRCDEQQSLFFETIHRRKDGTTYPVEVHLQLMHGTMPVFLAIIQDISRRKDNEARIELLSRTYRLLSRVNEAIVRAPNRSLLFEAVCNAAMTSDLFMFTWIGMLDKNEHLVMPMARSGAEEGYTSAFDIRIDDEKCREWPIAKAIREGVHVVKQDIENETDRAIWQDEAAKRGYRSAGMFPIREMGIVAGTINVYSADEHFFTQDIIELMLELAADVSFALDVFAEKKRRGQAEDEIRRLNIHLERRVAERTHQLELVNKELEAFCYSVSHDLRAPLRSIDGFSQVLLKKYHGQLDETGRDYLDRVRRSSQHMGQLIDDMLQLSQVTRGSLKRGLVDLSAIAEQVADELRKAHPERQVRFILQQGMAAHGDAGLLRIVMVNLLGNAWKYSGKKTAAEIEFGMQDRPSDPGEERAFFVRDNGAGFNMDYAQKLFGAFQRLHGASEFEGTGIGLATVQRIVHRHHGKVWAEGKEEHGATFYFTLPQRERESKEAA